MSALVTREDLLDIISDALGDSMDVDWNYATGARYVVEALIKEGLASVVHTAVERSIPTTCIEHQAGAPTLRLSFQIKVF